MQPARLLANTLVFVLTASLFIACGPKEPQVDEAREAEWAAILEDQGALETLRGEVADLEAAIAAATVAGPAEPVEGEPVLPTVEELTADMEEKAGQVEVDSDALIGRVVGFLNEETMIEGEPLTERQLQAIRIKSGEEMLIAQEYIDKGGDYRRAIDILRAALQLDPDNEDLKAALAGAEENRFVAEEKFAEAKKGMNQDEIRELLGPVNLRNIRKYDDKNVEAWFYPTSEAGHAAGVWFREHKRSGEMRAYQLKFDAVQPPSEQSGEE